MPTPLPPYTVKCWDYPCTGQGTFVGISPVGVHLYTACDHCGEDLSVLH